MIYYCEVGWLSRTKVLQRTADIKDANQEFMTMKNKPLLDFDDSQFMADFGFLSDISSHLAIVNRKLQQR